MKITVKVTAANIRCGIRLNSDACPIALAIKRAVGLSYTVCGESAGIMSFRKGKMTTNLAKLPKSAVAFQTDYDQWGATEVKPFRFTTDFPVVGLKTKKRVKQ